MLSSAATVKAALREKLRARGEALAAPRRAELARDIARRALTLPELASARGVLACLSFGAEVDTWALIDELAARGRKIYVPRVERGDPAIHLHPYPSPLRTLSFGLRQPLAPAAGGSEELPAEAVDEALDAALVLGLGFDRRGYRLGYGGGYFDRFLAARRFPAIGLTYACQLLEELPVEAHDVPMHIVVTENEVLRPAG